MISQAIRTHFSKTDAMPDDAEILSWVDSVRDSMEQAAKNRKVIRKSFACTLVLLMAKEDENTIVHVGDGAIVARNKLDEWIVRWECE